MVSELDSYQKRDFKVIFIGVSDLQDQFFRAIRMDFDGLRLDYSPQGRLNYVSWKDRMEAVPEDNGLKECFESEIPKQEAAHTQILA